VERRVDFGDGSTGIVSLNEPMLRHRNNPILTALQVNAVWTEPHLRVVTVHNAGVAVVGSETVMLFRSHLRCGIRTAQAERLLPLKLPAALAHALGAALTGTEPAVSAVEPVRADTIVAGQRWVGDAVEFVRVDPASGNMSVAGKQFWLGPARAGVVVTFWADTDVIHLLIAGVRVKSFRSHLSVNDLAALYAQGGRNAGPSPIPPPVPGTEAVEVDRTVGRTGLVSLGQHMVLAAEILAGRRVAIRVEQKTLMFFDPDSRDLLRIRPNPLTPAEIGRLRAARPAGPAPQPSTDAVRVQRRASNTGIVMVVGQKIALGRAHKHQTVAIDVTETDLTIHLDGSTRTVTRTTDLPVRWIKAHRPRKVESNV
jgi:hypothetical protein